MVASNKKQIHRCSSRRHTRLVEKYFNDKLSYRRDSARRRSLRCSRSFKVTDVIML